MGERIDLHLDLLLAGGEPGQIHRRIEGIGHQKVVQIEIAVAAILDQEDIRKTEQTLLQARRTDHRHLHPILSHQAVRAPRRKSELLCPRPVVGHLHTDPSSVVDLRLHPLRAAYFPLDLAVRIDGVDYVVVEQNRAIPASSRNHQIRNIRDDQPGADDNVQLLDLGGLEIPFYQIPLVRHYLVRGKFEREAKVDGDIGLRPGTDRFDLERGHHARPAGAGVAQVGHPVDQFPLLGQNVVQRLAGPRHISAC